MSEEQEKLELKFDPNTIEDLGVKMYSQLPQALAELVANAYDADADKVEIKLYDAEPSRKKIVVVDDGFGMSFKEVNSKFLRIGRRRRTEDDNRKTPKGRTITGRKGLGKLALFGIGKNITIETTKAGEKTATRFELKWDDIVGGKKSVYEPTTSFPTKENASKQGTTIILSELTRSTSFDLEATAVALSKMFNCIGEGFQVILQKNDASPVVELTRELRYTGITHEFSWNVEEIVREIKDDYPDKDKLKGKIVSSAAEKTMPHLLRGITLYVNGRLANTQGFFGLGETPHAFSYLSGWIDADFLDESKTDLISTDRQSISWDLPEPAALQAFLQKIVRYVEKAWLEGRRENKKKANTNKSGVNLDRWYKTFPNQKVKEGVEHIVTRVSDNPNVNTEEYAGVVKKLYELIPDYPDYYWRNLNKNIQDVAKPKFEEEDYHEAIVLALIKYVEAVTEKMKASGIDMKDLKPERTRLEKAFGPKGMYQIARHFRKPDGSEFDINAIEGLEEAQRLLSAGLWTGYRHPLQHGNPKDVKDSGIITRQNCIDALSILSMLFDRFEQAP
jgi:hypothetical protein